MIQQYHLCVCVCIYIYMYIYIYAKQIKTGSQTDICTPMFITTLFIIGKILKSPKWSSTDAWIKKIIQS